MKPTSKLTPTEQAFINEYLKNSFNGTKAYRVIRPAVKETTASVNACRLLRNARVKRALDKALQREDTAIVATDRETLLTEASEIGQEARKDGAYGPALKAVEIRAKLKGLFENQEPEMAGYFSLLQKITFNVNQPADTGNNRDGKVIDIGRVDDRD